MLVMVGIVITESFRPGTIQVATLVTAMCGILFMFIGNIMPKFRQNFFCGFRTPWALSDETVWNKTHRLAGRLMFGAGLLGSGGAFLPWDEGGTCIKDGTREDRVPSFFNLPPLRLPPAGRALPGLPAGGP